MIKNQRKYTNGFSMTDMLLAVAIIGIATSYFIQMYQRDLAKKQAVEYADQTKTYAKSFARAITDNYDTYYQAAVATPGLTQVLKGSQLQSSGYLPAGVSYKNIYKQTPCVTIKLNSSNNQLEAIMFYVLPSGTANKLSNVQGKSTMMSFGGEAGMVNSDGSITGSNWNLPSSSPFLTAAGSCDGGTIPKYSVAVNLAMLPEYSSNLQADPTLHRNQDNLSGTTGGDQNNLNTMQTDITMQSLDSTGKPLRNSGIYFSGNSNSSESERVYLGTNLSPEILQISKNYASAPAAVVLKNGSFQAQTIKATNTSIAFTPCKYDSNNPNDPALSQVGQIVTDSQNTNFQRQQLICTYNPTYCSGSPSKACYLPINPVIIQFHPNTNSFDCASAAGKGYYIQPGSYQLSGDHTPAGDEHAFCTQQWGAMDMGGEVDSNNGFPTSIQPTRHWENVGCQYGVCCSWRGTQTFTILKISCTNDTTTFLDINN